jgi:predicted amidohydrolase YtcJ
MAEGLMPADVVVTDARVYTARPQRGMAEALAVKDGTIVFVGNAVDADAWVGPHTQVLHLGGKLVLPGLFDSHIHPLDIVDFDVCDLESRPQKTLSDLSAFVRACARKAITIRDVIDAYTIGGARFLGREKQAGSIEVGKSGDFIVLDQDILRLADEGHAEDIRNTNVLETWFMGKRIYVSKVRKSSAMRGLTK